jgi:hypothetical protein
MNVRRSLGIALLIAAICSISPAGSPARAEVSAVIDAFGTYVQTVVLTSPNPRFTKIWAVQRHKLGYFPLNPLGDRSGDSYPLIADNWTAPRVSWVVWSRPNAGDLDLVWARWTFGHWSAVEYVQSDVSLGDDHKPNIAFDSTGRPFMVWERNQDGVGEIYVTVFLASVWMQPFLVSDPLVNSRNPIVTRQTDETFVVDFDTPDGRMSRMVTFDLPVSINDDITPMGIVDVSQSRPMGCGWPR